jgi:hypothetical protein
MIPVHPVYSGCQKNVPIAERFFVTTLMPPSFFRNIIMTIGITLVRDILMSQMGNLMKDLICYCFEYSREDIEQDCIKHGRSTIMLKIPAEKKMDACACTTKNPTGR